MNMRTIPLNNENQIVNKNEQNSSNNGIINNTPKIPLLRQSKQAEREHPYYIVMIKHKNMS